MASIYVTPRSRLSSYSDVRASPTGMFPQPFIRAFDTLGDFNGFVRVRGLEDSALLKLHPFDLNDVEEERARCASHVISLFQSQKCSPSDAMNLDREFHKKKSLQQFKHRRSNEMRRVLLYHK